jgi:hypothetical protein
MSEHSITAFYSNLPGPRQQCVLSCSCGCEFFADAWEDAGRLMDVHIDQVRKEEAHK